jgi:hypothetical protein
MGFHSGPADGQPVGNLRRRVAPSRELENLDLAGRQPSAPKLTPVALEELAQLVADTDQRAHQPLARLGVLAGVELDHSEHFLAVEHGERHSPT